MMIPFYSFDPAHRAIRAEVLQAMAGCYDSNWYVLGEQVQQFETEYAQWNGVQHAVGVASGLDALQIALKALDIGPGQEVVVASNAYIACWLAIAATGATIVPAEPDPYTHNLDPRAAAAALSARTAAIMPVHLFGQACDMQPLLGLAERRGIFIVEDNAQAHGARCAGSLTGSMGHVNATSFYPTKNLGALGDGGALTTGSDALARFARVYRNYGSAQKYYNEYAGLNSRLDEMQATVLRVKLKHLADWNRQREQLALLYLEGLKDVEGLQLPQIAPDCTHVWHIFVVQCDRRDALQTHLAKQGIQTMIHYPVPPHRQQAFAHLGFKDGQFPVAERLARRNLSLPLFPGMTAAQVEQVCEAIKEGLKVGGFEGLRV